MNLLVPVCLKAQQALTKIPHCIQQQCRRYGPYSQGFYHVWVAYIQKKNLVTQVNSQSSIGACGIVAFDMIESNADIGIVLDNHFSLVFYFHLDHLL